MIYYTSLGFFSPPSFLSVPSPHEAATSFPLPSVGCVSEYRHRTEPVPLAPAIRAFFSPPLSWRCALLGMQEGSCTAAKSYTDGNWGRFLFVSSAIPCCPPSHFSSGVTSFFPCSPGAMSTDAIRQGHANFVIRKQPASQAFHKIYLFRPRKGLIIHSLSPESMLVSGSGVHIQPQNATLR